MKFSNLFKVSIAALSIATIYNTQKPSEIFAFTIGGSTNNACNVMKAINHADNYMIEVTTTLGTVQMPFLAQFDGNCAKTKNMPWAVNHINGIGGRTNVFILKRIGDIVVYVPDLGEYDYLTGGKGSMSHVYGNDGENRHGTSFLDYSVPANDTSCGYNPRPGESGAKPVCIENVTLYSWGHFLANNTATNREALAQAQKNGDQATINRLTGEWEVLGYSWDGSVIDNPYFPSDYPIRYNGSGNVNAYPAVTNPWVWGTTESKFDYAAVGSASYNVKYDAVTRFKAQENMRDSVGTLMKKLSLKNDSRYSGGVFEMRGDKISSTKRFYALALVNAPVSALNNVSLMELGIYDGDTKVASWTRKAPMSQDGDSYVMRDSSGKLAVLEGGKSYILQAKVYNDSNQTISTSHKINFTVDSNDNLINTSSYNKKFSGTSNYSSISKNGAQNVSKSFKLPEVNGAVTIKAVLDYDTYGKVNHWRIDDYAQIIVQVESQGDLSACGITIIDKETNKEILVDKDGVASDLVQDRLYDVQYKICYDGNQFEGPHTVYIDGYLSTTGDRSTTISLNRTLDNFDLSKNMIITETIRASNPQISTKITVSTNNKLLNKDLTNDTKELHASNAPNISLTQLKITPSRSEFKPGECPVVTVSYNLTLTAPKNGYNAVFNTQTRIKIGSKEYTFVDKIKKGTEKHTHTFQYCLPNGDIQKENVTATANINKGMFESTHADNSKTIVWEGLKGDTNRVGCPVGNNVSNSVTWNQTYSIYTYEVWNEGGVTLEKLINTEKITKTNETESFKITSIQMRSKLQQDLQLGSNKDGWVEVIQVTNGEPKQVATPKIKAGYGFEIKVITEYETNVFDSMGQLDLTALNNGQKQTIKVIAAGEHDSANLITDFYINIDGKLTMKNGEGLTVVENTQLSNKNKKVFEITITPHNSPNTNTADDTRIYVSDTTKDGKYKMTFYTPAIVGLSSRSEKENQILCDDIEFEFEVIGSVYDDLNSYEN